MSNLLKIRGDSLGENHDEYWRIDLYKGDLDGEINEYGYSFRFIYAFIGFGFVAFCCVLIATWFFFW